MRVFYPSRIDAEFGEPGTSVIDSFVGSHGPFHVLTGPLLARDHERTVGSSSQGLKEMMRFHLSGAGHRYKPESGPQSGKFLLFSIPEKLQVTTMIYYYSDGFLFHCFPCAPSIRLRAQFFNMPSNGSFFQAFFTKHVEGSLRLTRRVAQAADKTYDPQSSASRGEVQHAGVF
jgi:hypothetical protein